MLPHKPDCFHLGPQRWMFDPEFLTTHEDIASQIAPFDQPAPPAVVYESDWCKNRRRNYRGREANAVAKKRRVGPTENDHTSEVDGSDREMNTHFHSPEIDHSISRRLAGTLQGSSDREPHGSLGM